MVKTSRDVSRHPWRGALKCLGLLQSEGGGLHGRRLWQAIQQVLADGLEVTPSLALALALAAVKQIEPLSGFSRDTSLADGIAEDEFLAGCLTPGGTQLLAGVAFSGAAPARLKSTAALAFPIQAAGAELLKEALALLMPRLWSELPGVRLCHVIHDEILLEAPEALAQDAADLLLEVMQDPGLQTRYLRDVLPLVAEVSVGRTWTEAH